MGGEPELSVSVSNAVESSSETKGWLCSGEPGEREVQARAEWGLSGRGLGQLCETRDGRGAQTRAANSFFAPAVTSNSF